MTLSQRHAHTAAITIITITTITNDRNDDGDVFQQLMLELGSDQKVTSAAVELCTEL